MSVSQNVITIPIGTHEAQDYMLNLTKSISEVFMLVFERRDLSLDDNESLALWHLAHLQSQLIPWKD